MGDFLFRGTSENYPGHECLQGIPATCTSRNIFVAYLFAIDSRKHGGTPVILVFDMKMNEDIEIITPNNLAAAEEEVVLKIKPLDAFDICQCKISADEFLKIINEFKINSNDFVTRTESNITVSKGINDELLNKILNKMKNV